MDITYPMKAFLTYCRPGAFPQIYLSFPTTFSSVALNLFLVLPSSSFPSPTQGTDGSTKSDEQGYYTYTTVLLKSLEILFWLLCADLDLYPRGDAKSTDTIWSQKGPGGRNRIQILTLGDVGESQLKFLSLSLIMYNVIVNIIAPSSFKGLL